MFYQVEQEEFKTCRVFVLKKFIDHLVGSVERRAGSHTLVRDLTSRLELHRCLGIDPLLTRVCDLSVTFLNGRACEFSPLQQSPALRVALVWRES